MGNWFECKLKYEKVSEDGLQKKVTETYLVDAMSFTEAEKRIIEEMTPFISGEFEVNAVKKNKISEMFVGEGGRYYNARVSFVTLDEKSGMEKKTGSTVIVQADDFGGALDKLTDGMKGTMSDWEVSSLSETGIVDIFGCLEDDGER